ncbi:hypothetical protein ALC62_15141 [Cyphomyrmex costatus]|uniref:Uncharacterized protein n=1 Tax=Cyphomyrmex costatus TaxID=456900 RepID=A0A151I7X7_9HYME|nr:hypothetical protein ALC62_15141 [Cyphomyrmex costatus]
MLFLPAGFLHSASRDDKIRRNSRRNALCLVIENRGGKSAGKNCVCQARSTTRYGNLRYLILIRVVNYIEVMTNGVTKSNLILLLPFPDTMLNVRYHVITFIFYGTVTVRVAAAVRCPGPCTGSIRITVTHDQRIHAAGPVDRHTLAPSIRMHTSATA